jgi:pimeloyl-ACP methyl ester carboxylesterase
VSIPFNVSQQLFPVQHRFLELDGGRIHYVDEGTGKTLLLHGNPSWCFLYRKIIAGLKSDFRCGFQCPPVRWDVWCEARLGFADASPIGPR